jgi:hypothetical protein
VNFRAAALIGRPLFLIVKLLPIFFRKAAHSVGQARAHGSNAAAGEGFSAAL